MLTGIEKKLGAITRFLTGKRIVPIALGGLISMLIVASALYMSTSAGRSSLPSPLPVQVPHVPPVASIVPSASLFEPPAPPPEPAPAAGTGNGGTAAGNNLVASYPYITQGTGPVAAPANSPVLAGGLDQESRHQSSASESNKSGGDHDSHDDGSHDDHR